MVTVGIHPNDFDLNPNKIPTGGVVQNCPAWTGARAEEAETEGWSSACQGGEEEWLLENSFL